MPAPPGNINAVKTANVPKTFYRRVLRGQPIDGLFKAHPWLLRLFEDYESELIDAKGGDDVTPMERRSIEIAGAARRCWAHALAEGDTGTAKRFMDVERSALVTIGLERRARPVPRLADYLEAKAASGSETP